MIFGKAINRYYLKHAPVLLLGILSLLTVDYIQLLIPELYRLVINGVNLGQVVVDGQTLPFTREVLFQHICLPMIWIVVLMVIGRFLWRVCFFGSAVSVAADLRERMFDHSRRLSQQYYQVNKVGNLMSLYTNDLDTIQECFGDGILMFFDAAVLGIMALVKMWRMDCKLTLLALIPAAVMGILLLFQPDYIPMTSSIIQFCAPSAGLTAIFAARFRHDTTLAAKTVAISTLLSILTMPLFCVALQTIYGV